VIAVAAIISKIESADVKPMPMASPIKPLPKPRNSERKPLPNSASSSASASGVREILETLEDDYLPPLPSHPALNSARSSNPNLAPQSDDPRRRSHTMHVGTMIKPRPVAVAAIGANNELAKGEYSRRCFE
jgi:hypothetical protein